MGYILELCNLLVQNAQISSFLEVILFIYLIVFLLYMCDCESLHLAFELVVIATH